MAVKYGTNLCLGTLSGALPDCTNCATVPTERQTWGKTKDDYKR